MIAKGTAHANGGRLASYMITGKDGERAELYELRGFAERDPVAGFRSVHVMAQATNCEQPFFHCQVRNPEGEKLTRAHWQSVADRIEKKLGLDGQPRAIAFHEKDGDKHMHVAWSRIDGATLKAKPLPFFKLRLKEVCRQMEAEFGLTKVRNDRAPDEPRAARRAERDQAQRLGVDINAVRAAIRDAWTHADNGTAFAAAIAEQRLTLARGDKRDYVVIDAQGGLHALGKRLLGVSAAETRHRLADIDPALLLTIEAVRENQRATLPESLAAAPTPAAKSHQADHDEDAHRHRSTASDNAGMVAQNAEANRRHLELNPFLKAGQQMATPDRAELDARPDTQPLTAEEKQQRIEERARQISEQWQQVRDNDLGRDR